MKTNCPEIFFLPGIGCKIVSSDSRSKFVYFSKSATLAKDIAVEVSRILTGRSPLNSSSEVKSIVNDVVEAWKELGGEKIEDSYLSEEKFSFDSGKEVNWEKIKSFLNDRGFTLEQRKMNLFRKLDYPLPIFEVKDANGSVIAEGKGFSEEQAKRSALAEAIERLVAKRDIGNSFRIACQREITELRDIEFDFGPRDVFSPELVTEWIQAYNFSRKEWSWMPTEYAFLGRLSKPGIKAFSLHHSAGLAAGDSFEDAVRRGLFEVLEREAYWNVMRCRMNCPDIDIGKLEPETMKIIEYLKNCGLKIVLKDISLDWPVNIIHATLIDEEENIPTFAHGTGAAFKLEEAIRKAVAEVIQVYSGLVEIAKHERMNIVSVEGVLGYNRLAWQDPLFKPHIMHLIEPSALKSEAAEKAKDFRELIEMIKQKGHEVLATKLEEIEGLQVARVYVTGATQPDDRLERISERLRKFEKENNLGRGLYWDPVLI